MMIRVMIKTLLALCTVVWFCQAHAEILENDPRITVKTIEPARDIGYSVGDVYERTAIVTAKKPLKLVKTSLPIVGYERRYKGQLTGIELRAISTEEKETSDSTVYTLHLTYQIFTNSIVAKPAVSPPEIIKFSDSGKFVEFRIPSWSFRISPLAVYGSVKIEYDMSKYRGPLLLDSGQHQQWLQVALAGLAIAALGLLYILGTTSWLPKMGGPFARAYRDLKKLGKKPENLSASLARLHQALNTSAGASTFDALGFVSRRPAYAHIQSDIAHFFSLSRGMFFENSGNAADAATTQAWLLKFCRRCRDIERGMK